MFERFTEKAIKTITSAQDEAADFKHNLLYPEHLLLGIVNQSKGISAKFLKIAGINSEDLRDKIKIKLSNKEISNPPEIYNFSESFKDILNSALKMSEKLGNNYVLPEHLFLALLENKNSSVEEILNSYNMDLKKVKTTLIKLVEKKSKVLVHPEFSKRTNQTKKYYSMPEIFEETKSSPLLTNAIEKMGHSNYELLGTEQIFQSILDDKDSNITKLLAEQGITTEKFEEKLKEHTSREEEFEKEIIFTPNAFKAMNEAAETAKQLGSATVNPEHIVLGILKQKSGIAYKILKELNVKTDDLYKNVLKPIEKQKPATLTIIKLAKEECLRLERNILGTEMILLGLLGEGTGIGAKVLNDLGITTKDARKEIENIIGSGNEYAEKEITFTPRAKRLLEIAWSEAKNLNCSRIESEHLLLGIIKDKDCIAMKTLANLGVDTVEIKQGVLKEISKYN